MSAATMEDERTRAASATRWLDGWLCGVRRDATDPGADQDGEEIAFTLGWRAGEHARYMAAMRAEILYDVRLSVPRATSRSGDNPEGTGGRP